MTKGFSTVEAQAATDHQAIDLISSPIMDAFLRSTDVVDAEHPAVAAQAARLARPGDIVATARACFEFVRDEVGHSRDAERDPSTCRASDVLRHRTGYCYAKSHLLAALLRAGGIPAGFCYQRLSVGDAGPPFSLHGFNAVLLPGFGWYRVDPRGNKPGVDAQFCPPTPRLAFAINSDDECEFDNVLPDPLDVVVQTLRAAHGWRDVLDRLPDVRPADFAALGLRVRPQTRPATA